MNKKFVKGKNNMEINLFCRAINVKFVGEKQIYVSESVYIISAFLMTSLASQPLLVVSDLINYMWNVQSDSYSAHNRRIDAVMIECRS